MTYSLSNNCTKNYYNRTLTVEVIVEDVVTWIFLKHSVEVSAVLFTELHAPPVYACSIIFKSRMTLSRAHTSTKSADAV